MAAHARANGERTGSAMEGVNNHVFSFKAGEQVSGEEDRLSLSRRKTGSSVTLGGRLALGSQLWCMRRLSQGDAPTSA
jgi:hypothetical protein